MKVSLPPIDKAYEVDEVKDIRDKAAMLEAAMRIAGNHDAEMRCWEIRRRAEAKAAKLYDVQEKAKGAAEPGTKRGKMTRPDKPAPSKTLAELGVSSQEMSEWRELSKVPQKQFIATLAGREKPTNREPPLQRSRSPSCWRP